MEECTELKEFYLQICRAQSNRDFSFFERYFSQQDGVVAIGTDPNEWWEGYIAIKQVFKAQLEEMGELEILADSPQAYREGSIGWVAGQPIVKLPDGSQVRTRLTVVFRREADDWKIVQWHFSTGISNEELVGRALTT